MNQETKTNKTGFTTKSITMMALFAAILCISAYISIPLPIPGSPHITLLNFVIIVIALLFPLSQSFITILVWMALGAIGLPVFIGGGSGIGYLTNIFGGYTFSFLVIAIVLPLIRGKKYNRILYTVAAIVGVVLIDIIGMLGLIIGIPVGMIIKALFEQGVFESQIRGIKILAKDINEFRKYQYNKIPIPNIVL